MMFTLRSQGADDEFINTVNVDSVDIVNMLELRLPLAPNWKPIKVRRVHPTSTRKSAVKVDMPFYGSHVIFLRPRAVEVLHSFITRSGELLPVEDEGGDELYMFNALSVLDALDMEKADLKYFSDGRIMRIARYEFRPDVIRDVDMFRIPQMRSSPIFLSQRFVDAVQQEGLTGAGFENVWSTTDGK
jgi:hypothetical protein